MPSTCHDTASPVRKGWVARPITSQSLILMNHDVLRLTPHSSAQLRSEAPDSMSDT